MDAPMFREETEPAQPSRHDQFNCRLIFKDVIHPQYLRLQTCSTGLVYSIQPLGVALHPPEASL